MTDAPIGDDETGDDSGPVFVPPAKRRSTYTPPPAAGLAEPVPPTVPEPEPASERDYDDAIADALAAQYASYLPAKAEPGPAVASGAGAEAPKDPAGGSVTDASPASGFSPSTPAASPALDSPGAARPDPDDAISQLGANSTLEAIERLEQQLRLREQDPDAFREWQESIAPAAPPSIDELPAPVPPQLVEPPPVIDVDFSKLPGPAGLDPADLPPYGSDPIDSDDSDVVDDLDPAPGAEPIPVGLDGVAAPLIAPSQPIAVVQIVEDEVEAPEAPRRTPRTFELETSGIEPAPADRRAGRSIRLFWLWFAPNASVLSIAVGAMLASSGMSLRQSIIASVAGIALSWIPLGFGTLAGKWTGQPMMIVSRAVFGHLGNLLPAILALLTRAAIAAVLLWLFARAVTTTLDLAGLSRGLSTELVTTVALAAAAMLIAVTALVGYGLLARIQLIATIVAAVLIGGLIVMTAPRLDLEEALSVGDGSWLLVIPGAALVFGIIGLAWAQTSGDVARYQRPEGWGSSSMLLSSLGATAPALLLVIWGVLLGASDPVLAAALSFDPVATLAALLPLWYPLPLIAAVGVGLISGSILASYSAGFALQSIVGRISRPGATSVAIILIAGSAAAFSFLVPDVGLLLREVATTAAVPIAGWTGIVAAEMMFRNTRLDAASLQHRGRLYPDVRWLNLGGLLVASGVGLGLTHSSVPWLAWQGYLFPLVGLDGIPLLVTSDVGVFVALALGLLLTLITAYPVVRRQERASGARDSIVHTGAIPMPVRPTRHS